MKESRLILFIGIIQFINILDFMMVMPLGPDLAAGLGLPAHLIGVIGGSYTLAAAIAGVLGLFFLDGFVRRKAVLFFLAGLAIATTMGALSWDLTSLLAARVLAGLCGGPLTALTLAIIADEIPPERRGSAMGKVMGGFAAASVIGVPFGLELAAYFGWRAPFICFGGIASIVWGLIYYYLHLNHQALNKQSNAQLLKTAWEIVENPLTLCVLLIMALAMMAGFMIIPNIAAHLQENMHFPRQYLGALYCAGGAISFFSMRYAGKIIDRTSVTLVGTFFTMTLIAAILLGFVFWRHTLPVILIFILFMVSMTGRNVAGQTLASKVPKPAHRAAFMSLNSAVTHFATSIGAIVSSQLLSDVDGSLVGVEAMGLIACGLCIPIPFLMRFIETRIKRQHV